MLEGLDKLPLPLLAFMGIGIGIMYAVRYFGITAGEKASPTQSHTSAQVAAVIVDSTALQKATAAIEAHTKAHERLGDIGEDFVRHIRHLSEEVDNLREEIRLQRELDRRRP